MIDVKNIYVCFVNNNPNITSKELAKVNSKTGQHIDGYNDDDKIYFHVENKTINYFPNGLEKLFSDLIGIIIISSHLKEIHQIDLKPYSKLIRLYLPGNDIEVLEDGLFDFNSELKYIALSSNKFIHIHPKVFDKLPNLISLYMDSNNCISKYAIKNAFAVQKIISEIKTNCLSPSYVRFNKKMMELENDSKDLNPNKIKRLINNINNIRDEMKNSSFPFGIADFQKRLQIHSQNLNSYLFDTITKMNSLEEKLAKHEKEIEKIKAENIWKWIIIEAIELGQILIAVTLYIWLMKN